ncbi:DUF6153 family protein [Streptomyces sp. TLI_185]|uniref:DUF6153 family protein n=1 Tax=Streptomyces sp. TLI_185 TaxID=2485151 RepID=UPI000F4D69C3|nr:DUF6153 family protein [Streptomyces sp. TLI_185]RPF37426.1 hypothetical protein EDD92_7504 [Streptomyces sp. TLI_185]
MTSSEQQPARPPLRRWRALLVLGLLLVGLLGMHALAPGGLTPGDGHTRPMAVAETMNGDGDCIDGQCGGCLAQHADTVCASAAVSEGPRLPALTADPAAFPAAAEAAYSYVAAAPDGARAPPSLAELQLLRI